MDKKQLSERDICTKFITPALRQAGWDEMSQIREEVSFTKGRIIVRGKLVTRGKAKRADYVLYYKPNIPLALIEAKDNNHSVGDGMQQALDYADDARHPLRLLLERRRLRVPRPHRHERRDRDEPRARRLPVARRSVGALSRLEGPDAGSRSRSSFRTTSTTAAARPRATTRSTPSTRRSRPSPRARTASCWSWRPAPARPTPPSRSSGGCGRPGRKKRILFLADRNVLIDQTMVNDFRPFGAAMAKLSTSAKTIERDDGTDDRPADRASTRSAASTPPTRSISASIRRSPARRSGRSCSASSRPDFFDLIVIDECHRGSAAEDSAWREILDYFSARHADRPDRHAEGNEVRLQHRTTSASRSTPTR